MRTIRNVLRVGIAFALLFVAGQRLSAQDALPAIRQADVESEAVIRDALDGPLNIGQTTMPLSDFVAAIGRAGQISTQVDIRALEDAGASLTAQVTNTSDNISLRSALNLILGPLDLAWIIKGDTLLVTTKEKADAELRTVVYPVADLVTVRTTTGVAGGDYDSVLDVITTTIAPTTWDEVGGPGSIAEFRSSGAIVVSQTQDVHEQVTVLLAALRKARQVQGIKPVFVPPEPRADSRQTPPPAPPRFVIQPNAAWQLPRTHE